ncbi:MAG: hypothetical protein OXL37_09640 [Chloroflexota bacterium]|nr:hypothetical protein [Chloroflexota bacterium]MDE2960652.1 hypothetical protein [Chloroflexota bacterium]
MEMIPDDDILEGGRHPITYFRYCHAQDELRADAGGVAFDTGYDTGRALSYGELFEMTHSVDTSNLSREELRRFWRMDLALEVADENGATRYLAVEISFYAEPKGIDRAIANARLLERFTGCPASAVIAVGRDYRGLSQSVLNGEYPILLGTPGCEQIYLYQLNERNIERAMADKRYERRLGGY